MALSSSWWHTNWTSPIEHLHLRYRLPVYDSYQEVQVDRRLYELRELTSHKEHAVGSNIKHTYEVSPSAVRIQVYFVCASHSVLNLLYTSTRSCIMYTSMKGHLDGFIKLGSPLQFSG